MSTLGILVLVIASVLLGFFINSVVYHARSGVKVGGPAPGFVVERLDGKRIGQADWNRPPQPVILCFVSPKCNVCRRLTLYLQSLDEKYPEAEIDIIIVGLNGSPEEYRQWKRSLNLKLDVATDTDNTTKVKYAIYALPTAFFISSGGLVRHIQHGFRAYDDQVLEKLYLDRLERMEQRRRAAPDEEKLLSRMTRIGTDET